MIANNRIVAGDIDKVQALAILVKKKLADLTFLLGILHFIYNDHPFFAKDYIYVRPQRPLLSVNMPAVNNDDGFFNDLPIQSEKKRGCKKLRMTKQEKKEWEIIQLEAR